MIAKIHILHTHLDYFPEYLDDFSEQHGVWKEMLHNLCVEESTTERNDHINI